MLADDDVSSIRMIRSLENNLRKQHQSGARGAQNSKFRVPILALSTSRDEDSRFEYIQNGYVISISIKTFIDVDV
jgi:hypothetical protein